MSTDVRGADARRQAIAMTLGVRRAQRERAAPETLRQVLALDQLDQWDDSIRAAL